MTQQVVDFKHLIEDAIIGTSEQSSTKAYLPDRTLSTVSTFLFRPNPDESAYLIKKGSYDVVFDSKWVVPYNPYLLQKYDCRINTEICSSVTSIKFSLRVK